MSEIYKWHCHECNENFGTSYPDSPKDLTDFCPCCGGTDIEFYSVYEAGL